MINLKKERRRDYVYNKPCNHVCLFIVIPAINKYNLL